MIKSLADSGSVMKTNPVNFVGLMAPSEGAGKNPMAGV